MKKILTLLILVSLNVQATDLMSLYDRALQHNIEILDNKINLYFLDKLLRIESPDFI